MIGWCPDDIIMTNLRYFVVFERRNSKLPYLIYFSETQVNFFGQFAHNMVCSPGRKFRRLRHRVSVLLQIPQLHPQICILFTNDLIFLIVVPEIEVPCNYYSVALLGNFLHTFYLLFANILVPIKAFIMHATHNNILALSLKELREEHTPTHETGGKGNFVKIALVLGQYESIIPTHRDHSRVVITNPAFLRQRVQQINKLTSYFLKAYEIGVAQLQYLEDTLISDVFVVGLKPNVVSQQGNCFRKLVSLVFLQLFLTPKVIQGKLISILDFAIQNGACLFMIL